VFSGYLSKADLPSTPLDLVGVHKRGIQDQIRKNQPEDLKMNEDERAHQTVSFECNQAASL